MTIITDVLLLVAGRVLDELVGPPLVPGDVIADKRAANIVTRLSIQFGARLRYKDVPAMRVVAAVFDVARFFGAGVPGGDDFVRRFATTIGADVFVPRDVFASDSDRLVELVTHECEHVAQFRADGIVMAWWYASLPEERVRYEADAVAAGLAARVALGHGLPTAEQATPDLVRAYHVQSEDAALATDMLRSHILSLAHGVVTTEAGRCARTFIGDEK